MLLITATVAHVDGDALAGKERDTLRLSWEERRWTRKRAVTTSGRGVALALPTGSVLAPGDIIAVEAEWYLEIEGRPESVLELCPRSRDEAIRIAFEVGNRHFPLAQSGDLLRVPDDRAMEQLLTRLGVAWQRREAVFAPISGGGHRHEPGTSPLDGHAHAPRPPAHG